MREYWNVYCDSHLNKKRIRARGRLDNVAILARALEAERVERLVHGDGPGAELEVAHLEHLDRPRGHLKVAGLAEEEPAETAGRVVDAVEGNVVGDVGVGHPPTLGVGPERMNGI